MSGENQHIGIIGTGIMGSAIARRLADCGVRLSVFDIDPAKTESLHENGATVLGSPAEVVDATAFVILSLPHEAAVEDAVFGEDGVASVGRSGRHLIDMSSISPTATRAMAVRLRDACGMVWMDCPLSGGAPKVKNGALAVMVGGTQEGFDAIRPVMSLLASTLTLVGSTGAGQAAKLVNQLIAGCAFQALAEAVTLAEACGVDASQIADAIRGGRADSNIVQEFAPMMATRDYAPTGTLRSMVKDFATIEAEANAAGLALPVTNLTAQLHRLAVRRGHGEDHNAAILELYRHTSA